MTEVRVLPGTWGTVAASMRGELREVRLPRTPAPARKAGGQLRGIALHHYWSGLPWQLGTAAYWEALAQQTAAPTSHRLGRTLCEEVGACLLGGYGMPYVLANAAFLHLRTAGVFDGARPWTAEEIERLLAEPLDVEGGARRYRFPRQRAVRISEALKGMRRQAAPEGDLDLRDWLLKLPGIGPKTAGWIVRNHRDSDCVAIIDIHLIRAGTVAGIFSESWRPSRDYDLFEAAFIGWAGDAGLRASHLDAVIWGVLARDRQAGRHILGLERSRRQALRAVWPV